MRRRRGLTLLLLCGAALAGQAAVAADPKVPSGTDPGGVVVVVAAGGVDYKRPEVAARLARDGEGELLGYDFADDDRTPYAEDGTGADAARALIVAAPKARIAPLRVTDRTPDGLAKALAFVARSPARIALLIGIADGDANAGLLEKAAAKLPNVLFVFVTARDGASPAKDAPNVIALDGAAPGVAERMASIAALAVDALARDPSLDGAALKGAVQAGATAAPAPIPLPAKESR